MVPLWWFQVDWRMPRSLVKHDFRVCWWEYFQRRLASELMNWTKQVVRGEGRGRVSPHSLFWSGIIHLSCPQTSEVVVLGPLDSRIRTYTSTPPRPPTPSPSSQAIKLNYTLGFPGSLACRQHLLALLTFVISWGNSHHKSPRIYLYLYVSSWSASLENLDEYTHLPYRVISEHIYKKLTVCHLLYWSYVTLYNCSSKQENSVHGLISTHVY